ncbi:PREDICTED: UDP-N-acetylglucosamine transferase subunit ALG14 homolog [Papilio xuthus]|uniref:UDP-N-acetylglucosamine transferase subunit ALG14 n=1 Tax=Papilio xuthus TaxID=66420 RepID=I4DQF6_PAPXU|nr:PREDICTED: UDP-N-acetylglucosamine transferase subunit ALG14 homolog [Papilio xuthus]BAM20146.1 similar to CG6308 [Papilio xuthus]
MEWYAAMLLLIIIACFIRVICVFCNVVRMECNLAVQKSSLNTIICIGSGGHTTEMLRLIPIMNKNKFKPRLYILSDSDVCSEIKIHATERSATNYGLSRIPRCRKVRQSYLSSVFSTLYATFRTIPIIYKFKPDVILCNGPGTCIPVCAVAFMFRCLFLLDCRIIFIESICRVRTLSLSGRILQYFADLIIVQWPHLRNICLRAKYLGRLT